jgi:CheY-specific phosphatase CheX
MGDDQLDAQQFFEMVASVACQELFGRYGVAVQKADETAAPVSPDFLLCSVIGFTGRDVRGSLVLALTEELSGLSNPVSGPHSIAGDRLTQRDWVGELSNQLLGRIKIELLKCGVEIYLNLPAVLLGQHLAPLPRAQLKPLKFTLSNGAAAVWIEIEARPGFRIDTGKAAEHGPGAGDTLLFE